MPPNPSADGPAAQWASFTCDWRREGPGAASVMVSGEVDIATARRLDDGLRDALGHARLVLLDLYEMSFIDCTGLRVSPRRGRPGPQPGCSDRADGRVGAVGDAARSDRNPQTSGMAGNPEPGDEPPRVAEVERRGDPV